MTNDEIRTTQEMSNEEAEPDGENQSPEAFSEFVIRALSFFRHSDFDIRQFRRLFTHRLEFIWVGRYDFKRRRDDIVNSGLRSCCVKQL